MTLSAVCFGGVLSGSVSTDKKFTGQRFDSTGLYYYGARYYDPTIGRFISADTIVQNFTNPQTLNRYSYTINNPLKYTDPSGHMWISDDGGGAYIGPPTPEQTQTSQGTSGAASDLPLDSAQDNNIYNIVWGYSDSIDASIFSYSHSVVVGVNGNGDYLRVETWGGQLTIPPGAGWSTEIYGPGTPMTVIGDGAWILEIGASVNMIPILEISSSASVNTNTWESTQNPLSNNEDLAFTLSTPKLLFGEVDRVAVSSVSPSDIFNGMPRWVTNMYRYRFDIDYGFH
ncbi:MAG: RHS repeat-associated core domain-containing protein [Dehalogenimonas sp.]